MHPVILAAPIASFHETSEKEMLKVGETDKSLGVVQRTLFKAAAENAPHQIRPYMKIADRLYKLGKDFKEDGPIVGTFEFLGMLSGGFIGGVAGARLGPEGGKLGGMAGAEIGRNAAREVGLALEPYIRRQALLEVEHPDWFDDALLQIECFKQIGKGVSYLAGKGYESLCAFYQEMSSMVQTAEAIRAEHPTWSLEDIDVEYFKQLGQKVCENWTKVETAPQPAAETVHAPRAVVESPLSKAKTEAAIASFKQAVEAIQTAKADKFAISAETAADLKSVAEFLSNGSTVLATTAIASGVFGASSAAQRKIANATASMQTAAAGFSALSRAGSAASFTGVLGIAQIALGAFSLIKSLFGEEEVNGFEVLQRQIAQMYQRISHKLDLIHHDIQKLEARMARLERITVRGAQEIYFKDLYGCIEKIRLDLSGEFTLDESERRKVALKLITWLDMHSKSPLITGLIRQDAPIETCIEILEDPSFELHADLPLYLSIYNRIQGPPGGGASPLQRIGKLEYRLEEVDNLKVITALQEMLSLINDSWEVDVSRALERSKARLAKGNEIAEALKGQKRPLVAQCEHLHFEMGRALHKKQFFLEIENFKQANERMTIFNLREYGERHGAFNALNTKFQIESKELLEKLPKEIRLRELLIFHSMMKKEGTIAKTWTMAEQFVEKSEIAIKNDLLLGMGYYGRANITQLKKALCLGAASAYTRRGSSGYFTSVPPLITLFWNDDLDFASMPKSPKAVELLLKAEILPNGFEQPYGNPIAYAKKHNQVGAALVLASMDPTLDLAQGTSELRPVTAVSSYMKEVQSYILDEMRNSTSQLKRDNFIKAYKFYRDIDEGKEADVSGVEEIPLMFLTSCLGNVHPLKVLNRSLKYNYLSRNRFLALIYRNVEALEFYLKNKSSAEEKARITAEKPRMLEFARSIGGDVYFNEINKMLAEY